MNQEAHQAHQAHLFSVFMPRIAAKLQQLGFNIISIEPNKKDNRYMVYKFEDTPEFQIALEKITRKG